MMAVVAILIGLTTGVISGLIGLGGGVFIVPALVYVFKMSQHEAQGTSLATLLLPIGLFGFLYLLPVVDDVQHAVKEMCHVSFRRILIAVDESPIAAHAADVGAQLATALGAELARVYVVDPTQTVAPDSGVPAADLIALAEKDAKRLLAGFRQRAPQGNPSLEFVAVGKPASEIVKTAKEWPADVIVIGSHGRHGLERALLGSVAEGVMRHAPCSVLVVRTPA